MTSISPVSRFRRHLSAAGGLLIALAGGLSTSAYAAAPAADCGTAGAANTFAARAYSLSLDSTVAGIDVDLPPVPDTRQLPSRGGEAAATLATVDGVNLPILLPTALGLNAAILHNTVMGSGNMATAHSSVTNLDLNLRRGTTSLLSISADALTANSTVSCVNRVRTVDTRKTGSEIVNLAVKVLGVSLVIPTSARPNTRLALPLALRLLASGSITLNEQVTVNGRLVVNALHVKLNLLNAVSTRIASIDLVISHAEANTACGQGSNPNSCNCTVTDFVTGGGIIPLNPGKAMYAVNGGSKVHGLRGQFNLINQETRQHITGDLLTAYSGTGQSRKLSFRCSDNTHLNNASCVIDVEDNGPANTGVDKFGLTPGYPKRLVTHGNILLHKPVCSAP